MNSTTLFLGMTGSVATRLAPNMIEKAHENGFDRVIFHPTEWALPFLVESIFHALPELEEHIPSQLYIKTIREKINTGDYHLHSLIQEWFRVLSDHPPLGSKKRLDRLSRIMASYESGDEQESIWSREKGNVRHIDIVKQSSVALIAPATANTIARIVAGTTDNFLLQVIRAMDHSGNNLVFIAPAMNTEMLHDPFTQRNLRLLREEGSPKYHVLPTEVKMLQCWEFGDGAMLHIDEIFQRIREKCDILIS